jgi:hypothetical protein
MTSQSAIENLLSAVTDALLQEEGDLETIIRHYDVPRGDVEGFIGLIRRLHVYMVGVQPSRRFVRRLKQDLIGEQYGMIARFRHLPPRVQIAAGVALVAGFMIFQRRRMAVDSQEAPETAIAQ